MLFNKSIKAISDPKGQGLHMRSKINHDGRLWVWKLAFKKSDISGKAGVGRVVYPAPSASPNLRCRVAEEETADYADEREFEKKLRKPLINRC